MIRTCENCHCPIQTRGSRSIRFCSRKCHDLFRTKPRPERICESCGKSFPPQRHLLDTQRFCTRACYNSRTIGVVENLFWKHVEKEGPVMPGMETPCWIWTGARDLKGYGRFRDPDSDKTVLSHRKAKELSGKSSPLELAHLCNNPPCCRPDHTQYFTRKDHVGLHLKENPMFITNGKLTPDQVRDIRGLLKDSVGAAAIAAIYDVSRQAIYHIQTGRSWAHLS